MINIYKVAAKNSPFYFYCTSYLSARKKYNRLMRDNRLYIEGRRPYAGKYTVLGLPLIDLERIISYDTYQKCNKHIEELREKDPENCLNTRSITYSPPAYQKKYKKRTDYTLCRTCNHTYRNDYIKDHYNTKIHKKRSGLPVNELSE